jgi:predicted transcriptional regulator
MSERKTLTVDILKKKVVVKKELLDKVREDNKIKNAILNAMKDGPKTIPEISRLTGLPTPMVTWWLMTLRKYGAVVEVGEVGEDFYYKYKLKEEVKK